MTLQATVYVPPHPLIQHWLGVVRDRHTPGALFRPALGELGRWLTYEAVRRDWLPLTATTVETPLAAATATFIDPMVPVVLVPILRAGLTLLEGSQNLLPLARVYHFGVVRDEATLEPTIYLNKLPAQLDPDTRVLVLDPMLATGGTLMAALEALVSRGAQPAYIRVVAVIAAPPALQKITRHYPQVQIYTAGIDETLNEVGFIVPGLGDAGDRSFGTM
ncbi:uracil phosphoribosyltransferase [Gloeomargarita lithophora]|uniref:uracil phosphoribosyltransferase n=1 Tax=Gloeomargarita lithophora TaxID=1188228 RepID=UPI0008F8474A|nr:uracil phosphoribosyltransferase [Gloeomargarita lithophora]